MLLCWLETAHHASLKLKISKTCRETIPLYYLLRPINFLIVRAGWVCVGFAPSILRALSQRTLEAKHTERDAVNYWHHNLNICPGFQHFLPLHSCCGLQWFEPIFQITLFQAHLHLLWPLCTLGQEHWMSFIRLPLHSCLKPGAPPPTSWLGLHCCRLARRAPRSPALSPFLSLERSQAGEQRTGRRHCVPSDIVRRAQH